MSTLTIEERIRVNAPPARVWAFLLDPARVAPCLPGAKLDGVEGEKTFLGTMKVKVGPVTMDFKGKATMTEIHEAEHRVVMTGTGSDKGGSGSAKMSMESRILPTDDGGSEIVVVADVDLAGKLMGFGRGMMGGISKQLFKQFAERVRAHLAEEEEEEEESAAEEAAPAAPAEAVEEKAVVAKELVVEAAAVAAPAPAAATAPEAPAAASDTEPPKEAPEKAEEASAKSAPAVEAEAKSAPADTSKGPEASAPVAPEEKAEVVPEEKAEVASEEEPAAAEPVKKASPAAGGPAKVTKKKKASTAIVPEDNAPLSAGGLVFAAFWEWLKGLFRRLFGGGWKR
jgi:carbon monoxide dehydrogenase subunit G